METLFWYTGRIFLRLQYTYILFGSLQFAGITREQLSAFQSRYADLLTAIRPQALNIVDSFDIRDEILNSPLGCWDGNVYQSK